MGTGLASDRDARTGGRASGRNAVDSVAAGLAQLTEALSALAPRFAPSPVPCGEAAEVVLERLFAGEDKDCAALLRHVKETATAHGLWPGDEGAGRSSAAPAGRGQPELRVEWAVDVARRRRTPSRVLLVDRCAALLWDLPRLIQVLTSQQVAKHPDSALASELVQRFLRANGHDLGDAHLLQDAVSVAYSAFVLHKELRLTESRGERSLRELIHASFPKFDGDLAVAAEAKGDPGEDVGAGIGRAKKRRTGAK